MFDISREVPPATLDWLLAEDNPAVAAITRRSLLGGTDVAQAERAWARRNEYFPVAAILEAMRDDGSWAPPARDYQKYRQGSLWQVHFLGELHADGDDERVRRAADYAFSRQLDDGSWSCSNRKPAGSVPCLTANVGRALARLGYGDDPRIVSALAYIARIHSEYGYLACPPGWTGYNLNGYCHMLAPKVLLFLGEVPRESWPDGARELSEACVEVLRDKEVLRCLPVESKRFQEIIWDSPADERPAVRERFLAEHQPLRYGPKPGWLKFGFPLSYNSDALEALAALAAVGETRRPEYEPAIEIVRAAADEEARWRMRNSLNGKMIADVETKGAPSKWLTLRALGVLAHFGG